MASRRILILEDDAALSDRLTRVFANGGYDVHSTGSVTAFIQAAREARFDACLLELAVRDGDGLLAWEAVRPVQANAVAIVMTGRRTAEVNRRAVEAAVRATVEKPIDDSRLLATFEPGMDLP